MSSAEYFQPAFLKSTQLPTNGDVMKYLLHWRSLHIHLGDKQNINIEEFFPRVLKEVVEIWDGLGIPIISETSRRTRIKKLNQRYRTMKKVLGKISTLMNGINYLK